MYEMMVVLLEFAFRFMSLILQTFGVITMRVDALDGGNICPARPSASTQAQSTSHSSLTSLSMVNKNNCPYLPDMGTEVEIHNLLIIDQNTFEGNLEYFEFGCHRKFHHVCCTRILLLFRFQFCTFINCRPMSMH